MSLNKVMLIGNVGKDPDVRYLENNPAQQGNTPKVSTFTLATTERYRDRNGNQQENTEWHNIVAWRGLADTVERFVKKGTQLYVEGKIRTRSWTDQTGAKRYTTEIIADTIQLLGRRSDNPASQTNPYQQAAPYAAQQPANQYPQQAGGYQSPAGYQPPVYQQGSPYSQPGPQQPAIPDYSAAANEADDLPF